MQSLLVRSTRSFVRSLGMAGELNTTYNLHEKSKELPVMICSRRTNNCFVTIDNVVTHVCVSTWIWLFKLRRVTHLQVKYSLSIIE